MSPFSFDRSALARFLFLAALVVSGEAIFLLPFVLVRIFRPTFLDVFGLTNLELGTAFSVYGMVAIGAYFAGGPLADRFPARRLMAVALIATSLGGVVYALIPSIQVLTVLYGFWGLTTILLFWAPLIRATRVWGGQASQGKAYGLLDSGRGLLAALIASLSVFLFASLLPAEVAEASLEQRTAALSRVILIFSTFTFLVAALVWLAVPENRTDEPDSNGALTLAGVRRVIGLPTVWLQAIIVVCAYVGYKVTDDFSLLARDVFGYDEVRAATIGTISFWVRPFAAVSAGFLGDRILSSRVIAIGFVLLILGSLFIAAGLLQPGMHGALIATLVGSCLGIYSLRGVYFAVFEEAKVPLAVTGSAVGIVSVIGYTPDVFMGPMMGYLLDSAPGIAGHQHLFGVVAIFGVIGLLATWFFQRLTQKTNNSITR